MDPRYPVRYLTIDYPSLYFISLYSLLQPQPIDSLLKQSIGQFLNALQDPDLNVRRVALVAFNSAAHNKPSLICDLLDSVLPQLYAETNIKVLSIIYQN